MKKYIDAEGVMRACYDSFLKTGNKAYREIFALVEAVPAAGVAALTTLWSASSGGNSYEECEACMRRHEEEEEEDE